MKSISKGSQIVEFPLSCPDLTRIMSVLGQALFMDLEVHTGRFENVLTGPPIPSLAENSSCAGGIPKISLISGRRCVVRSIP